MIYIGSCENCKTNTFFIEEFLPNKEFIQEFKKVDKTLENYVKLYYKYVLKKLDPEEITFKYSEKILVSYEKNEEFSYREIVAAWLELYIAVPVPEVKEENGKLKVIKKNRYYNKIKDELEVLIKQDINMGDRTTIAAAHLDEIASLFDQEDDNKDLADSYRILADVIEENNKKDLAHFSI